MFAILGSIEFDLITYFDGLEISYGADYAEHALIGRKPRLQHVGDKLDEIKIDLVFHASYCSPEAELLRLRKAVTAHEAMSFVLGNGDYRGRFVITNIISTGRQTDKTGSMIALDAQLALREYTGDPATPRPVAVVSAGSPLPLQSKIAPALAIPKISPLAQAVSTVKGALSMVSKALSAVAAVKQLASTDPLTALARLPGVGTVVGNALPGLGAAVEQMGALKNIASVATDAAQTVQRVSRMRGEISSLTQNMASANAGNLLSVLTSANGTIQRVDSEIQGVNLPLARMTAAAVTRRVGA
ncbi:phage tail protein [Iodobacter arcticus]|uniref:Phage tail protein n=1 Tax=Iodobacter arcticus TaxID=590593 RepID=A0ABW2R023_9NEIS